MQVPNSLIGSYTVSIDPSNTDLISLLNPYDNDSVIKVFLYLDAYIWQVHISGVLNEQ